MQFDVYEVRPLSQVPTFVQNASLVLSTELEPHSIPTHLAGELFLIYYDNSIIAWNIERDTWVKWETKGSFTSVC
jgi:hypothetical protein